MIHSTANALKNLVSVRGERSLSKNAGHHGGQLFVGMSTALVLAGCSPNLYSLPFFTSTTVHNDQALRFLKRGGPAEVGGPGPSLKVRDPFADGKLVALTASGGGMRASAFTLGVLVELDDLRSSSDGNRSALDEVDLLSSVSGGSWAIAAMLTARTRDRSAPLGSAMPAIEAGYAKLANAKVRHWAEAFIPAVTGEMTYSDIYPSNGTDPLPFAYFNASLYPSQSPFVFTPAYMGHYVVTALGDPADPRRISLKGGDIAGIPIGYAATASSAVPGYTAAFAETRLCDMDQPASFCFGKGRRDSLQILDGGLYDNIGYKTLLEVTLPDRTRIHRGPATVIMIDSSDVEDFQTMAPKGREDGHVVSIAMASSFPNQNATFDRLRELGLAAAGFDARILLDFSSAAGFDVVRHGAELRDLPELAYYAAHDVGCFGSDRRWLKGVRNLRMPNDLGTAEENLGILQKKGGDCTSMNFARAGYLYKTSFKFDEYRFRLNYQLGRLVVRMNRDRIIESVFRTSRQPAP